MVRYGLLNNGTRVFLIKFELEQRTHKIYAYKLQTCSFNTDQVFWNTKSCRFVSEHAKAIEIASGENFYYNTATQIKLMEGSSLVT